MIMLILPPQWRNIFKTYEATSVINPLQPRHEEYTKEEEKIMWENSVILKLHFLSGGQTVNKSDFKEIHCSFEPADALLWLVSSRREGQIPSVTPTLVSAASPLPPPARSSRVSPLPLLEMSQVVTVVIVESIALRIYWATLS